MIAPALVALGLAFGVSGPVAAQQAGPVVPPQSATPVLVLDWEKLYANSLWGKRVASEIQTASSALRDENNRIAGELETEERALTEKRPTMASAAFQTAADAFDKKATSIRAAQKAKADAIQTQIETERQAFVKAVVPKLDEVLRARGAEVMLDSRAIIRGLASADVTAELGQRIDREIGDGSGVVPPLDIGSVTAGNSGAQTGQTDQTGQAASSAGGGSGAAQDAGDQSKVFVDDSPNKATGAAPLSGSPPKSDAPLGLSLTKPTQ